MRSGQFMGKNRKIFAYILALATLSGSVAALGACEDPTVGNGVLVYELSEDGDYYAVHGSGFFAEKQLVIPDTHNDLPVKEIADHAFRGNYFSSVVIGDSVEYIGEEAFYSCRNLTSVDMGASVAEIGACAFASCGSLQGITVDVANATYRSLDGNLYDVEGKTLLQYAVGKQAAAFVVPDTVETIAEKAFAGCLELRGVVVGTNVTLIEPSAFEPDVLSGSELDFGLEFFYYKGGEKAWRAVEVSEPNSRLAQKLYFYSETEPEKSENGTAYDGQYWHYLEDEYGSYVPTPWTVEKE